MPFQVGKSALGANTMKFIHRIYVPNICSHSE